MLARGFSLPCLHRLGRSVGSSGASISTSFCKKQRVSKRFEEWQPQLAARATERQQRFERIVSGRQCSTSATGRSSMASDVLERVQEVEDISYLTQEEAQAIDEELMGMQVGYTLEQLMEMAGLSVACSVAEVYFPNEHGRVLVICGPGNNGGDGLVAARHLSLFGYKTEVCYPKPGRHPLYQALLKQLHSHSISVRDFLPDDLRGKFDLVVDAMFGFSFSGTPRPPFDSILRVLAAEKGLPLVSIDIPSGWDVEQGDVHGAGLRPEMLVSLTAPKLCARGFEGQYHFLGGRFVTSAIAAKYKLNLPAYVGTDQCVRIGKPISVDVAALREDYGGVGLLESEVSTDPVTQFQAWFLDAVAAGVHEPNAMTLASADATGRPSARMVLLKGFDHQGFVWYTNYGSRKATELAANPRASLVFFWERLHRQVRVEGRVEKVAREESAAYFHSRPRGSQIGAIVSSQSSVISGRDVLDKAYEEVLAKYADESSIIRMPDFWGGYRLVPDAIEFWQGRSSRLHDRLRYSLHPAGGEWKVERLAP